MSKVLYIKASPRQDHSHSIAVADAFINEYLDNHPDEEVMVRELFRMDLPAIDGAALQAKYTIMHGGEPSAEEKKAWGKIEEVIADFKSANKYVFAIPMWNFGIPYRLKHYIDVIVQPGYTFSFTPGEGYKGLVTGKPAFISYASGGVYSPGTPGEDMDFQRRYMSTLLGFIGFEQIHTVATEPTMMEGPEVAEARRKGAIERAVELARKF